MLLTEFKQLQDIDGRISKINLELQKLYKEQTVSSSTQASNIHTFTNDVSSADIDSEVSAKELWVIQTHASLADKWSVQGVSIPSLKKLQPILEKAYAVLIKTNSLRPEIFYKMRVVLVPPTAQINDVITSKLASGELVFTFSEDYQDVKFSRPRNYRKWRVLIVFGEPKGLYLGTPAELLSTEPFAVAEYDAASLGLKEYQALILQESDNFDTSTWTVLLRNCSSRNSKVPSVKFNGNTLHLAAESTDNPFGDVRLRPAIEIA